MNDLLAAEPDCFQSSKELKALLDLFGPATGRYHLVCPNDWIKCAELQISQWDDVTRVKANTLLRRALDRGAFIAKKERDWDRQIPWIKNMEKVISMDPDILRYVIAKAIPDDVSLRNAVLFEDLDLPPTAEERIQSSPDEYVRVSKYLLRYRPELIFIDPYMNPCEPRVRKILLAMFKEASFGRCESIKMWVRDKTLIDARNGEDEAFNALAELCEEVGLNKAAVELNVVNDMGSKDRMHGRYLLTIMGGIKFDQGFQQLKKGVSFDVSPIGSPVLDSLIEIYLEGKNDFRGVRKLKIR